MSIPFRIEASALLGKGKEGPGIPVSGLHFCHPLLSLYSGLHRIQALPYLGFSLFKLLNGDLFWVISVGELHLPPHPKGLSKPPFQLQIERTFDGYKCLHCVHFQWYFSIVPTINLQAADISCVHGRWVRQRWDDLSLLFFNMMFIFLQIWQT